MAKVDSKDLASPARVPVGPLSFPSEMSDKRNLIERIAGCMPCDMPAAHPTSAEELKAALNDLIQHQMPIDATVIGLLSTESCGVADPSADHSIGRKPTDAIPIQHGRDDLQPFVASADPCVIEISSSPLSDSSNVLREVSTNICTTRYRGSRHRDAEDEFSDAELDENFSLMPVTQGTLPTSPFDVGSPPAPKRARWTPPEPMFTPKKASVVKAASERHGIAFTEEGYPIPFIRPPFPKELRDRSPVVGLSNQTVHRTCFRIAQALNASLLASRSNTDAIIELFARVLASERDGVKQRFEFADLFTDKPPYLIGWHTFWNGVDLWEEDSRSFLEGARGGTICRVLGRMKRESGRSCELNILSIWRCGWYVERALPPIPDTGLRQAFESLWPQANALGLK